MRLMAACCVEELADVRTMRVTVDPENLVLRGVPFLFCCPVPIRQRVIDLVYPSDYTLIDVRSHGHW